MIGIKNRRLLAGGVAAATAALIGITSSPASASVTDADGVHLIQTQTGETATRYQYRFEFYGSGSGSSAYDAGKHATEAIAAEVADYTSAGCSFVYLGGRTGTTYEWAHASEEDKELFHWESGDPAYSSGRWKVYSVQCPKF
ncbi:hypothetical protein ACIGBL_34195 [Streptomyces sp. NPDC085614]|uniref:hypothetical protein n=1 Tax=Streptomyces sp. NPDC085614 TaxID=3365733 RepID=UPI0037CDC503